MSRLLLVAIAVATLGALPPFLLGAQFVLVGAELDLDERDLGVAVGVFFAAAAVASTPAGSLADRMGPRRSMVVAGTLAAASALTVALVAGSLAGLLVGLGLAGAANAALQMTANAALARSVPAGRRGLAFGVKQAAVPVAILLGGLAVPTVGLALGWRWTYGMVAVAAAGVVLLALTRPASAPAQRSAAVGVQSAPRGALLVTAVGTTLANGAATCLGSFLPGWAFSQGMTPAQSGLLLAVGAGACAAGRVLAGLSADRREGGNIPVVAAQLLAGAAGFVLLAQHQPALLVLGALVAFGVGWSWPGLLIFAIVRVGRDRPAGASSAVQAGGFLGGAAGPPLFGWLVVTTSYETGWFAGAAALVLAAALLLYARGMFLRDLAVRPLG